MTDVILATEQQATFLYINTAPQFQTFNGQNWVAVEISSRNLASDRNLYLDVYTGTYGIGQFWNETGSRAQTFLDWPAGQIPVPQLYYKILVNHADNSGVVFLGELIFIDFIWFYLVSFGFVWLCLTLWLSF